MAPFTRRVDPATGDRSVDAETRTWETAPSAELALVQNVLSTPLGSAARDKAYGLQGVDNALPNAAAVCRQNVLTALKRWIDRGVLRDVTVDAEVAESSTGHELRYRVTFLGASSRRPQVFNGTA